MKLYLFIFFLGFFVTSCGNKATEPPKETKGDTAVDVPAKPQTEKTVPSDCYSYMGKKDSIFLQMSQVYNQTSGYLIYKYDQKDKNMGTITGSMVNDLLIAEYTFRSEGVTSTRQVVFKKKGDELVEGFGEVTEVNGKMIFKDIPSLKYSETMVLKKVPCTH